MNQVKISNELKKKVMERAVREAGIKDESRPLVLRGHHLLCMQLFRGQGYSDGFSVGMTSVIERIHKNPSDIITLVKRPDEICANCPNLTDKSRCSLSDQDVVEKDEGVFRVLGVSEKESGEASFSYEELYRLLKQNMTSDAFHTICGSCRWRKAGLCSWELLSESFEKGGTRCGEGEK